MNKENLDQIIEHTFNEEPEFCLPANFSEKVTAALIRREQWKTDLFEYLNIAGILIFLIAVASGTYYFTNKDMLLQIYSFISQNLLQVTLVVFLLNFILFADRVLLRLLFSRWNRT